MSTEIQQTEASPPPKKPANNSPYAEIWHNLVVENPVLGEFGRAMRKIYRAPNGGVKLGPCIFTLLSMLFYSWILVSSATSGAGGGTITFLVLEAALFMVMMPGSIYNAISGEREKSTWEALILTQLSAGQIIFGKVFWRIGMLVVASLLMFILILASSAADISTRMTFADLLWCQLLLVTWGVLLTTFSLWVSATTKRSITSLSIIAMAVIALVAALPLLYTLFHSLLFLGSPGTQDDVVGELIMMFNPFYVVATMAGPGGSGSNASDQILASVFGSGFETGLVQSICFLALSAAFLYFTSLRLKQLEVPVRGGQ